ncbi:protein crumbs-like [Haliotis cracherodii]|uniref:protein crumbs-like n=1 Tax=Haliotis cracherodii TaxID=6455 RepID=UPI0039E8EE6C
MFVQPFESFDSELESHETRTVPSTKLASSLSASLKELGSEMQNIDPYKTIKRGEPPIRAETENNSILFDTSTQRTRGVIHALSRAQDDLSRPKPEEQQVPGYKGFHANMSQPQEKSRAIYYMTYSDPPSKTILYDVMCKLAKSINEKKMPFAIIVGDYPVYLLLLELKSEKAVQFSIILPFIAPFHIQMSFICAIYKRFKGSGISDVLVAACVTAEGWQPAAILEFKLRGWVLVFVLSTSVREKIPNAVSTTQLLPSTHAAGTWSNHEDKCEDSSCVTCKRGFYGQGSCNMTCNQHCMLGYCNSSTGACKYGCVNTSNYSLTSPWYGPSCSESCISNCSLGRCFRNGTCYLGCKNGTFGEKCEDACPKNCYKNCKKIGGECDDGCKSGFYGKYCNRSCSMNCLGGRCQQNGTCYNCTVGFQGDTCKKTCPKQCASCLQHVDNCTGCKDGRYGHKCIVCDNCKGKCRFNDGRCTDGCKDGYYGDHCNVSCSSGCQSSVCDQSIGKCSLGCTPTMYGRSCDQTCSRNCMEGQCHNRSGMECSIGCRAGFWGQYCGRPCGGACLRCNRSSGSCMNCTKGTYGRHCEKNCSLNCFERKCNISGTCVSDCISSYHGNNCSFRCPKHCSTCDQESGTCSKCVTGWTGEQCEDEESDPIDTGDEEIALYLTAAADNGTSDVGPQWNDICGRVSSATTSTDLDSLADTSLSRLLTSSAARTSSSIVNIREGGDTGGSVV